MTPQYSSWASAPRLIALANGVRLVGVVGFEVDNNSFYQADSFRLTLCLSAQPPSSNWTYWASQIDIEVELLVGFPSSETFDKADLTSLLIGNVDDIAIDPIADQVVMSGRDLTSRFIDNKTAEKYKDQTASQIATLLAFRRQLVPVVTATTVKAGTYYDYDNVGDADDRPEWDLLTYLAQVSNFVVYVKGRELHFEPKPDPTKTPPYVLRWEAGNGGNASPRFNATTLAMNRNLTVAKDIIVTVRSWNVKQNRMFVKTANRSRVKSGTKAASKSYLPPQKYVFTITNKTAEETQQYANQMLAEISQHEMNINAQIPGDPALNPRVVIKLEGTGTAFDQLYYPASVLHQIDVSEGYRTTVRAKNTSPESTVVP